MNPISRAVNIVTKPNTEWQTVAMEPASPAVIMTTYVAPLAAISPIASFFGLTVIGVPMPFFGTYRENFVEGLVNSIVAYVVTLVGVMLLGLIVNLLAPSFGAQRNYVQALKVSAYAATPAFLAGIVGFIPMLSPLAILGAIYTIVLIFLGLPVVMFTTKERAPIYTLAVFACAFVAGLVLGGITMGVKVATMAMTGGFNSMGSGLTSQADSAEGAAAAGAAAAAIGSAVGASAQNQQAIKDAVNAAASAIPQNAADPQASMDPAAAAAAGVNMLKGLVSGNKTVANVPREQLEALLPVSLGDMTKSNANSTENTVAGIKGTSATANYKDAAGTVEIDVTDLGNASGLAAMTGTLANLVESSDDDGFEKNVELNGQKVHESWKVANKHSEILGVINGRFSITVTGDGVDMSSSEQAFQTIDQNKLNDLAATAK